MNRKTPLYLIVSAMMILAAGCCNTFGPRTIDPENEAGWAVLLDDAFDGDEIDREVWDTGYPWGRYLHGSERAYYTDGDNLEVSGGAVRMIARKEPITGFCFAWDEDGNFSPYYKDFDYTSGMLYGRQPFRYGYFEARMRFDPTLGKEGRGFPAWWAFSVYHSRVNNMDRWAELDFFEAYAEYSDYSGAFVGTVHDWNDSSKVHYQSSNNWQPLPEETDFNKWHTYGCLWTPGEITWYFDDVPLMTQKYSATAPPEPIPNAGEGSPTPAPPGTFSILDTDPEGMLLILGSDPNWPLYVDWVRVWQSKDYSFTKSDVYD